jgi:hypothetical protein
MLKTSTAWDSACFKHPCNSCTHAVLALNVHATHASHAALALNVHATLASHAVLALSIHATHAPQQTRTFHLCPHFSSISTGQYLLITTALFVRLITISTITNYLLISAKVNCIDFSPLFSNVFERRVLHLCF